MAGDGFACLHWEGQQAPKPATLYRFDAATKRGHLYNRWSQGGDLELYNDAAGDFVPVDFDKDGYSLVPFQHNVVYRVRLQPALGAAPALPPVARAMTATSCKELSKQWQHAVHGVTKALPSEDFCSHFPLTLIPGFQAAWAAHEKALKKIKKHIRRLTHEGSDTAPYEDGRDLVVAICNVLDPVKSSNRLTAHPFSTLNQAGSDKTRPDVAWCGFFKSTLPSPENLYKCLRLVLEYKNHDRMHEYDGIREGIGQLISRAHSAMTVQNQSSYVLPGAVLDNYSILPVVVLHSTTQGEQRMYRAADPLILTLAAPVADGRFTVNTGSEAFKALVQLCFVACNLDIKGAAGDPALVCFKDGDTVSVATEDGSSSSSSMSRQYTILRRLGAPSCSGCAYLASVNATAATTSTTMTLASAASQQQQTLVVLKVGPPPSCIARAAHLRTPMEQWLQVQNECRILRVLGNHGSCALPMLIDQGLLQLAGDAGRPIMAGAAVAVTQPCGEPLLAADGTMPAMTVHEVEQMIWQLLNGLVVLQANGIIHGDVHLRNIGRRWAHSLEAGGVNSSSGSGWSAYLYDFGTAMTVDQICDAAARGLRLHAPVDLYTSALEVLNGNLPTLLADSQALFCIGMLVVGGRDGLPWGEAAAAGDEQRCFQQRMDFMRNPSSWPWWGEFSPALRRLMVEVFNSVLSGTAHDFSLAAAINRLLQDKLPAAGQDMVLPAVLLPSLPVTIKVM